MPAHVTPRNLLGDARIDLEAQLDDLGALVAAVDEFDATWQRTRAHIMRRLAHANRARHQADESIDLAQSDRWDGRERRAVRLEVQATHEMAVAS